jgi:hypothetical protein
MSVPYDVCDILYLNQFFYFSGFIVIWLLQVLMINYELQTAYFVCNFSM